MEDAEVGLVLQLLGFKELGVTALLLEDLLHKALVGGFREPALFVQESQDTRRTGLHRPEKQILRLTFLGNVLCIKSVWTRFTKLPTFLHHDLIQL